ncbi:MAG: thioesterase family protein [Solirubrobacterales bacterium]
MSSLFEPIGDGAVRATAITRGPWAPNAQHGGAPATLLGRTIERVAPEADMRVARITFELVRPVPVAELRVEAELVRPGRRVQLVAARLHHGDQLVMQALALRMRRAPGAAPAIPAAGPPIAPLPGPEAEQHLVMPDGAPSFGDAGVELRFARGGFLERGPATVWIRLRVPVLPGEPTSPLCRALAAADFGNGVSSMLDWETHVFINPDLTVHLEREPVGEWVALDATTTIAPDGTGLAVATLHDERGRIGVALQSLFVDAR